MNQDHSEGYRSADGGEHSGHPTDMHEPRGHNQTHDAAPAAAPARQSQGHEEHAGHDKHAGHSVAMFRQKFLGSLILSVPTIIWAPVIQQWFGYGAPGGPAASRWISAIFGTLVFAYGGWVFIKGAVGELSDRKPGMMTLIAWARGGPQRERRLFR
jgi:Cu2+-exporting ATPase